MTAVAILVALLSSSPGIARSASRAHKNDPRRPTIVLVHGAWADASSWSRVIKRLQSDGYTVYAPPDPLRGIASDSAYLASFLKTIPGPVVLVGHSYGGAVITNAATTDPEVKAPVYVDAFIPDQGQTILQLVSAEPGSYLHADSTTFYFVPFGPGAGDVDLYVRACSPTRSQTVCPPGWLPSWPLRSDRWPQARCRSPRALRPGRPSGRGR